MQVRIISLALCLTAGMTATSFAQEATVDTNQQTQVQSGAAAQVVTGDTNIISQGSRIPDPVGNVSVFTPSPSAPCQQTAGGGAGWGGGGVGISMSRTNESCERRENARMMLSIAAATLQLEGRDEAVRDVRLAREILMGNPDVAEAQQRLWQGPVE